MGSDIMRGAGVTVIIVAGGSGSRMRAGAPGALPKQFAPLAGVPILVRTLRGFMEALPEAQFIVALPDEYMGLWDEICDRWEVQGTHKACAGGANRFESVRNALSEVTDCRFVAVHDGVRPLFTPDMVAVTLATAVEYGAAVPAIEPVDSLRMLSDGGFRPVDRSRYRAVQTPQVFRADILRRAYSLPYDESFTDDATVVERSGVQVRLCAGERRNIKITTPEDMAIAEAWLGRI